MEKRKVKQLLELLKQFKDYGGVDDTFNIEHTIEEVETWLYEYQELKDDKIRADYE